MYFSFFIFKKKRKEHQTFDFIGAQKALALV